MISLPQLGLIRDGLTAMFLIGVPVCLWGQEIEDLKKGIVKITAQVEGKAKVGTGFIVRLEKDAVYIVTAAHVIEGDPQPQVAFYPRVNDFVPAQVLGLEGGDPRGVAALVVKGNIPDGLRAFAIDTKSGVRGGESVSVIGFSGEAATPWMVTTGTVGGRKGSDITFSGVIGEGNSGGPLLLNNKVVGVITQMGSKVSYAVPIVSARFAIEGWGVALSEGDAHLAKEIIGKDGAPMVLVPAGEFLMGEYRDRQQIYLDAFYIDKQVNRSSAISWREAFAYCQNYGKRLSTEAEWEKAVRGDYGVENMHDEWVEDWYDRDHAQIRPDRNPKGPPVGESNTDELKEYEKNLKQSIPRQYFYTDEKYELLERLYREQHPKPREDNKKVVRIDSMSRNGVSSMARPKNVGFRCAQDVR